MSDRDSTTGDAVSDRAAATGVALTIAALREQSGLRMAGEVDLSNRHVWQAVLHAATERGADIHGADIHLDLSI